ncbi:MAG: DinB family protein [Gemmatimonadota bacterium]
MTPIADLFDPRAVDATIARLQTLTPDRAPRWGKMNVGQMLAHCRVACAMALQDDFPRPNPVLRFFLRLVVKGFVTGQAPYRRNLRTAPVFLVSPEQDFVSERDGLIADLRAVCARGRAHFEGRPSPNFGPLTAEQWNTMLAKHLAHHLEQFGA